MRTDGIDAGAEVRLRRQRLYLSQRELASLAGCSLASITNFEHGVIPQKNASRAFARVLEVLDELEAGGQQ